MKRRQFIMGLGGAAMWPRAARAQHPDGVRRIGVLAGLAEDDPEIQSRLASFRRGLERRGWSDRNVRIDIRFAAAKADRYQTLARELVAMRPDVILAHSTPVVAALQQESGAVPIVFVTVSDPIGSGFIASLARPGGNLTGVMMFEVGITGKWLALLKQIAPNLKRAAFIANPKTTVFDYFLRSASAIAPSLNIKLVPSHVETAADIERAIVAFAGEPGGGLILPPDSTTIGHRDLIIELAARHRLPAVYTTSYFVAAGGRMSYGIDQVDTFRLAASQVDRILRGDKPAVLPVQTPTKYETAVNLKTAKALGLTVPPGLLVAADEVIEQAPFAAVDLPADYDLTRRRIGFWRRAPKVPHESNTESDSVVEGDAMEELRAGAKLADIERDHILATLTSCEGNRTRAANALAFQNAACGTKLHLYAADGVKVPEPKTGMGHSCD